MKLNCKPGDLAVIVKDDFPENLGKFVHVICFADPEYYPKLDGESPNQWECKPSSTLMAWDDRNWRYRSSSTALVSIADECLRPIRDPGDDAVDETLLLKPVPFPQLEPA